MLVAPIVGPTLGGWLSDNWSWHWCFLINGPIGALAIAATALLVPESQETKAQRQHLRLEEGGFDWIGFTLAATFLGALEIVLDRGLVEDWFGSSFIRTVAMQPHCRAGSDRYVPAPSSLRGPGCLKGGGRQPIGSWPSNFESSTRRLMSRAMPFISRTVLSTPRRVSRLESTWRWHCWRKTRAVRWR